MISSAQRLKSFCSVNLPFKRFFGTSHLAETAGKHTPYGKLGQSNYSLNTKGAFDVIDGCTDTALDSLDYVLNKRQSNAISKDIPITIADYGTNDAGTSMKLIYSIIDHIRNKNTYHSLTPIQIIYEDQASNDWNSVFKNVFSVHSNNINNNDKYFNYIKDFENVFVYGNGESFFNQCVAANSIDLLFSSLAMHWLSSKPCNMKNTISSVLNTNDYETELYNQRSIDDWNIIMKQRNIELKTNGRMIIVNFIQSENGEYMGNVYKSSNTYNVHEIFDDILLSMIDDKIITQQEFVETNFLRHYRTQEQMCTMEKNININTGSHLNVVSFETKIIQCPYYEKWTNNHGNKYYCDSKQFAKDYVPTTRTWSNSTILNGLDNNKRSVDEMNEIVDEFYHRYENLVEKEPSKHALDYVVGCMVVEKP